MDRQMERSLFGNAFAIQSRAETTGEESGGYMVAEARQHANKRSHANANKGGAVTHEGLRGILIQQGYRCALSGVVISPDNAELDHMTPLSKGGLHTIDNVQIVHPVVNALKGQMTDEEFTGWARLIASNSNEETDGEW
jgi:5-methylcytosine-specific restriction endonuclease McrA